MKILTIGRGDDCDIVLDDNQDLISRKHAMLRIYPFGKMELVSMGRNGTYVNGLPVKSNKPIKVSRKDVISFAHVKQLDWNLVKDPYRIYYIFALALVVLLLLFTAYTYWSGRPAKSGSTIPFVENSGSPVPVAAQDTTKNNPAEIKSPDTNLSKSKTDSLFMDFDKRRQKLQQDSINNAKKNKETKGKPTKDTPAPKDTAKTKPIKQVF